MNINRNNYESFFLLYVDNELSAAERNAVQLFVQENTDLQEELDMLHESVVQPEEVVFRGKNNLLKKEAISAETEEKLLLYMDRELDKAGTKEIGLLLAADSKIAAEMNVWQQTKLQPDTSIIFANKQSLYRKEEGRAIPFGWWKLAAAAVFVGFSIWGAAVYLNGGSKVVVEGVASNAPANTALPGKDVPVKIPAPQSTPAPTSAVPQQTIATAAPTQKSVNNSIGNTIKKIAGPADSKKQMLPVLQDANTVAVKQKIDIKPDNHLPKPYFETVNDKGSNNTVADNATQQTQQNKNDVAVENGTKKNQPAAGNNVYTTSFADNSDEDKEGHFTFTDDEPKKTKLTGFLRKASRVLSRSAKPKKGEDNIQVANLEFAIH